MKYFFRVLLLCLIGFIIFGLWPLPTSDIEIYDDKALMKSKEAYLQKLEESIDTSKELPNIILIVADDLGVSDINLHQDSSNRITPTLAHLASGGTVFQNAYCTSPICATSRAALLTGRYQNRFGFEYQMHNRYARNRLTYWAMKYLVNSDPWAFKWVPKVPSKRAMTEQGLPNSEISIAELLKYGAGYKTGIFGKWHLGKKKGKLPADFGFDQHYGFYNSHSLFIPENTEGYIDLKNPKDWTDQYIWNDQRDGLSAIVRNDSIIEEDRYLTDAIAQETISFIKRNKNNRFFAYVPFSAPHTPFQVSQHFYDQYPHIDDPVKRTYTAMINNLDLNIGKIYNYLNNFGLLMNTVIIVTSDNGGAAYTYATDNAPYKGGKINQFEGGLRVPFIIHQMNRYLHSSVDERVSTLDIFSTIGHLAQVPLPEDRIIDGLNLPIGDEMPDDRAENDKDKSVFINPAFHDRTLHWVIGDNNAVISGDYKLIYRTENPKFTRLYNITKDSTEQSNRAAQELSKTTELKELQSKWKSLLPKASWPGVVKFKVKNDGETLLFDS